MEFWSKGLGRRSLKIDCGNEDVSVENDKVLLKGTVKPPLAWKYIITMDDEDWIAFFEVAVHPVILKYLLKPKRWGILFRAGIQLALFFLKYLLLLPVARLTPSPKEPTLDQTAVQK